mmetsp:Transcript_93640/g.247371  ORF Transcript_93640/g.247371 Transcript_93640/m.247371 type:complete len:103 (+) Transcript_93640:34-342(+)
MQTSRVRRVNLTLRGGRRASAEPSLAAKLIVGDIIVDDLRSALPLRTLAARHEVLGGRPPNQQHIVMRPGRPSISGAHDVRLEFRNQLGERGARSSNKKAFA